jgi:hypothetical protein
VFLGNLRRLPDRPENVERLREASIWRHGDVSTFGTLAASILGSMPAVHEAIQSLNSLRAKVDAVRQTPANEPITPLFDWKEWTRDIDRARAALGAVRNAAESAESELAQRPVGVEEVSTRTEI